MRSACLIAAGLVLMACGSEPDRAVTTVKARIEDPLHQVKTCSDAAPEMFMKTDGSVIEISAFEQGCMSLQIQKSEEDDEARISLLFRGMLFLGKPLREPEVQYNEVAGVGAVYMVVAPATRLNPAFAGPPEEGDGLPRELDVHIEAFTSDRERIKFAGDAGVM